MGVVRREGKWKLEKLEDGVYVVKKREKQQAKIITDEYVPGGPMNDHRESMMLEIVEVEDFQGAKEAFKDFVEGEGTRKESGFF